MNHTTLQCISTLIQVGVCVKRFPLTYIPLSSFVIILCLTRTYSLVYVFLGIGPQHNLDLLGYFFLNFSACTQRALQAKHMISI